MTVPGLKAWRQQANHRLAIQWTIQGTSGVLWGLERILARPDSQGGQSKLEKAKENGNPKKSLRPGPSWLKLALGRTIAVKSLAREKAF